MPKKNKLKNPEDKLFYELQKTSDGCKGHCSTVTEPIKTHTRDLSPKRNEVEINIANHLMIQTVLVVKVQEDNSMSDDYTIPLKRAKITGKMVAKIAENKGFPIKCTSKIAEAVLNAVGEAPISRSVVQKASTTLAHEISLIRSYIKSSEEM